MKNATDYETLANELEVSLRSRVLVTEVGSNGTAFQILVTPEDELNPSEPVSKLILIPLMDTATLQAMPATLVNVLRAGLAHRKNGATQTVVPNTVWFDLFAAGL